MKKQYLIRFIRSPYGLMVLVCAVMCFGMVSSTKNLERAVALSVSRIPMAKDPIVVTQEVVRAVPVRIPVFIGGNSVTAGNRETSGRIPLLSGEILVDVPNSKYYRIDGYDGTNSTHRYVLK